MPINNKYLKFIISFIILAIVHAVFGIRNGNLGLISLADMTIIVLARGMNPGYAMLMAASATAFAELITNYGYYALYTFIIKGLEGLLVSWLYREQKISYRRIVYIFIGSSILKLVVDLWLYGLKIFSISVMGVIAGLSLNICSYALYRVIVLKRGKK